MTTDDRFSAVDLHTHSTVSDGLLTVEELLTQAKENGCKVISLTDHDIVDGTAEARKIATSLGMQFVPGVELSVRWGNRAVHVVGLGIDETDKTFIDRLEGNRDGRMARAERIAEKFDELGIKGTFEGARKYVTNEQLMSRKHFARYLVEKKICKSVGEVFDRFLKVGGPCYVANSWVGLKEGVSWIHDAGGIAVLAHPGRYDIDDLAVNQLIADFIDAGGQAMEAVTGSHTPDQYPEFARKAEKRGLVLSQGSDYHGKSESYISCGKIPKIVTNVPMVWEKYDLFDTSKL